MEVQGFQARAFNCSILPAFVFHRVYRRQNRREWKRIKGVCARIQRMEEIVWITVSDLNKGVNKECCANPKRASANQRFCFCRRAAYIITFCRHFRPIVDGKSWGRRIGAQRRLRLILPRYLDLYGSPTKIRDIYNMMSPPRRNHSMRPTYEKFWMYDVMSSCYMLIARFQGDPPPN